MGKLACLLLLLLLIATVEPRADAAGAKPGDQALLSLIFPDIDSNGKAHKSVVVRSLTSEHSPGKLSGDMRIDVFDSLSVSNGGHQDKLMVMDVTHQDDTAHEWGGETLLALFRLAPKPHLLDVVDVRADRETYFWKRLLARNHDSIIVTATHLNASEEYVLLNLVEVAHNKFVESGIDFPMIYSSKLGSSSLAETPTLLQIKNASPPTANFAVKVVAKLIDPDSEAVKKQRSQTFTARLNFINGHWQCLRCASMHDRIAVLEKEFGFRSE